MKIFTCLECGIHGCKLETEYEAQQPVKCPFGFNKDRSKWTQEGK